MARNYFALYSTIIIFSFFSCQQSEPLAEPENGRILIRLTDAPFPHDMVSEVNITISKVAAQVMSSDYKEDGSYSDFELSKPSLSVNLLQLTNGVTITIANTDIPEGIYSGLKLFISEASVRLKDNTVMKLNLGTRNGGHYELLVPSTLEVHPGLTKDLLLDFDVSRSFIPRYVTGTERRIAGFIFSPTVKLSDAYSSGSISGIITSSLENKISRLEGAQITVLNANQVITTTFTDFSGMYTVLGLEPGSYDIQVDMKGFDTQIKSNVIVKAKEQTKQGILLSHLQ